MARNLGFNSIANEAAGLADPTRFDCDVWGRCPESFRRFADRAKRMRIYGFAGEGCTEVRIGILMLHLHGLGYVECSLARGTDFCGVIQNQPDAICCMLHGVSTRIEPSLVSLFALSVCQSGVNVARSSVLLETMNL